MVASIICHQQININKDLANKKGIVHLTKKPQLDSLESAFIGFETTVKKVNNTQYASRGRLQPAISSFSASAGSNKRAIE